MAQEGWRAAGFSSANPAATDLCGCGVLGLLHLALLLERRPALAAQLQLAVAVAAAAVGPEAEGTEAQPPPQRRQSALDLSPVLLSVHASLWTLQALRQGLMARAARRLKSATAAAGALRGGCRRGRAAGGLFAANPAYMQPCTPCWPSASPYSSLTLSLLLQSASTWAQWRRCWSSGGQREVPRSGCRRCCTAPSSGRWPTCCPWSSVRCTQRRPEYQPGGHQAGGMCARLALPH